MPRATIHRLALAAALSVPLLHSHEGGVGAAPFPVRIDSDGSVIEARAFLDRLGVNGHVSWPGHYPYSDTDRVAGAMAYVGVRNLRDYINSSSLSVFDRLAARGVRFNLLLNPKVGLDNYLGWARGLAQAYPGSVVALEGPNEVDKWPVTFGGLTGYRAAAATQRALYAQAKADPVLRGVPVYNVTVSGISRESSDALGDLSAHADYANVHPYYRAGQQSWGHSRLDTRYTLRNYLASARWTAPGRPVVVTETGSTTARRAPIGVSEPVQAKQILNSIMAAAKHGAAATYVYELVDSHDNGPADTESHYGLYRYDWSPKPAAHALHNLTRIVGRRSAPARSPLPRYSLAGLPPTGASLLLRRPDGGYDIVLWSEPDLWDESAARPLAVEPTPVELTLTSEHAALALYDPLVGDRPVRTWKAARSITIPLAGHPVVLELAPSAAGKALVGGRTAP
ncbi:hypothetical protein [Phenylobacterium sp.]|uniref:hypothetical protein n=1 Tax=Phenylobacterium sp. TaxID=1871053 RepID=UPI0035AE0FCC